MKNLHEKNEILEILRLQFCAKQTTALTNQSCTKGDLVALMQWVD